MAVVRVWERELMLLSVLSDDDAAWICGCCCLVKREFLALLPGTILGFFIGTSGGDVIDVLYVEIGVKPRT